MKHTPFATQWKWTDGWYDDDFTRSSSSTWRPAGRIGSQDAPHNECVESGEGWLSPTEEAAEPKHHSTHTAKIEPMSAARMRAANKAAIEREQVAAQRVQWEEQPGWDEVEEDGGPEEAHNEDARDLPNNLEGLD